MSTARFSKQIPSCIVSQDLLQEIERVIQEKGRTFKENHIKESDRYTEAHRVNVVTKLGEEQYNDVKEFLDHLWFIEANTVELSYTVRSDKDQCSVSISFAKSRGDSKLRVEIQSISAHDEATEWINALIDRVKRHRNQRFLLHWWMEMQFSLLISPTVVLLAFAIVTGIEHGIQSVIFLVLLGLSLTISLFIVAALVFPYCEFPGIQITAARKFFFWVRAALIMILLGFVINWLWYIFWLK